MTYQFQCNRCFIVSGHMSNDPDSTPTCCGGEKMDAIKINNLTPSIIYMNKILVKDNYYGKNQRRRII